MQEWNTIISVKEGGFKRALNTLNSYGDVERTEFYNILIMKAENASGMLENIRERIATDPEALWFLSRLVPVTNTFTFNSAEEFEKTAKAAIQAWIPGLAGKSFHVRMHRRGFKGRLNSPDEEKFLDTFILESLEKAGAGGKITFENPDAIIIIETIGTRAGLSLWTREDLEQYPFLRLD